MHHILTWLQANADAVLTAVASGLLVGLISWIACRCRLTIMSGLRSCYHWLQRALRPFRLVKPAQCLPRHTIEFDRLVSKNSELERINRALKAELLQLQLVNTQKNDELAQSILELLQYAIIHATWSETQATYYLGWSAEYLKLITAEAVQKRLLDRTIIEPPDLSLYSINERGRRYLFEHGMLPKR